MPRAPATTTCGSLNEPSPCLQGRFSHLNRRLIEVVRHCGDVRFPDITIRPVICHIIGPDRREATGPHRHPFTELTWVEHSGVDYRRQEQPVRVAPGMFFFMPAMRMHAWQVRDAGSIMHGFMVSVQTTAGAPSQYLETLAAVIGYRFAASPELLAAFQFMERHAQDPGAGAAAIAAGYMRAVLGLAFQELGRLHTNSSPTAPPPALSASEQAFLRARDHLLTHLHQDTPLPEVAALAGITPRHLNRLFVERLGVPAGAFQQRMRIDRARHLLQDPGATVKSVAYDCGFTDPAYFSRAFRRQIGQSPAAYARSLA